MPPDRHVRASLRIDRLDLAHAVIFLCKPTPRGRDFTSPNNFTHGGHPREFRRLVMRRRSVGPLL